MCSTRRSYVQTIVATSITVVVAVLVYFASAVLVEAASLAVSPSTGVYGVNNTFSVRVMVNTDGKPVNAAEGTLSFNPNELSVLSVNRSGSIFNLWVTEPTFSNSAGTISFSGGSPAGYSGKTGTVMTITFQAKAAGTARVSFKNGSVLANDGKGTNILTAMNGGSYTMQAAASTPEPEVIEYVAPANTPAAPEITSSTHPDAKAWYTVDTATLRWNLPAGIIAVRTLLDESPSSIPTKVYDDPIKTITLDNLSDGVAYFHLQFKNADGWGRVAHYRLGVDTHDPENITITQSAQVDSTDPSQKLIVSVTDETSGIKGYKVKVDNAEPFELLEETASGTIALPALEPGYHSVIVEVFDWAGNSVIDTYSFDIAAFDKPVFTEYPNEINEEVIPVIKGMTRGGATVEITLLRIGSEPATYSVVADEAGEFIFIPEGTFSMGVYALTARATDIYGAKSDVSDTIRIAVQQPGYLQIGSLLVSVLSVFIPLVVLVVFLLLGLWYLVQRARSFRRHVRVESGEALEILRREFTDLQSVLRQHETELAESRRTKKLTKAEVSMIETLKVALITSQQKVEKEMQDVTNLTRKKE